MEQTAKTAEHPQPGLREIKPGEKFRKEEKENIQRFWKDPALVETLALSPEQIQAFDDEVKVFLEKLAEIRRTQRINYQKMLMALQQDPVDEALFEKTSSAFSEAQGRRTALMTSQLGKFRRILSHEQWKQLRTLRPRVFQIERFRPVAMGRARAYISDQAPTPVPSKTDSN